MIIIMGKSIHTLLCHFYNYIFPPLDAVCNDDWMFDVIHEIALPNVNVLRCFINRDGGVMLDNGEMLTDGNAGPHVDAYDRVFVILMHSHTLYCGQTLPLTLAECVTYLTYRMNIVDALRRYNYQVMKGKVNGEILYTIDMPCDPCGKPMSVNRTYCTSQVSVVMSREGPVPRSQIISMFMKSNMHIFEQCSQWQKE